MTDSSARTRRVQTRREELANSILHGIGTVFAIAGLIVLVVIASLGGDIWRIVGFSIYGSTLVLLYFASTLYHSVASPQAKELLNIIDHSSIFLLIAGTYTPITLTALRGPWGWSLFGIIWGLAVGGITLRLVFKNKLHILQVIIYAVMGWLCLIAIDPMIRLLPSGMLTYLVIGGVLYTVGIVFYAWKNLPYSHVIWHVFVLGGSTAHYLGILFFLAPLSV